MQVMSFCVYFARLSCKKIGLNKDLNVIQKVAKKIIPWIGNPEIWV